MGRFRNTTTGVVVFVDDSKDDRFVSGYEPASEAPAPKESEPKAPAKKAAAATPAKK